MKKYDEDARLNEQISLLLRAMESDSENVRNGIIVQLSLFGSRAVPLLASQLDKFLSEERRTLGLGAPKNSYLEYVINGSLKSLGMIQDSAPIDVIANALPRKEAVEALAKIGGPRALDLVLISIEAPIDEWGNQKGAIRNFIDPEQVSSTANDNFVRTLFIYLGDPGRQRLKEEIVSPVPRRRAAVAGAFRVLRDKDAIPDLITMLKDRDLLVKAEVARGLQELDARESEPSLVKELFNIERMIVDLELAESRQASDLLLYDQLRDARDAIEKAVLTLGDADSLVEVGFRPSPTRRDTSKFSVRSDFRMAIIEKGESAMPALTKFLNADDRSAQSAAAEIIAEIKRREDEENSKTNAEK